MDDALQVIAPESSRMLHADACPSAAAELPPFATGQFVDVTEAAGLAYAPQDWLCNTNAVECDARSMVGGAAVADFDADGLPDVYVTRGQFKDALWLNCGGRFVDVTDRLGISKADAMTSGAVWGDIDGDADLDLLVTVLGSETRRHYLYIQQNGQFAEDGVNRGVALLDTGSLYGTGAAFADYDNDGYLDLFIAEWRDDNLLPQGFADANHARLFHNRGAATPGYFDDVTLAAGLSLGGTTSNGILTADGVFAFTPIFSDLDGDGWLDLALSADYGSSKLFWNKGDGTFVDGTEAAGVGSDQAGMGADIADFDGDGRLDWFVTSIFDARYGWTGNRLYRGLGERKLEDVSKAMRVRDGGWGWGAAFADLDHDGDMDIFSVSGFRPRGAAFGPQEGGSLRFYRQAASAPEAGFDDVAASVFPKPAGEGRGLALLDFDADGDQDILVALHKGGNMLLRNDLPRADAGYVRLRLIGKRNTAAVGARLTVRAGERRFLREAHAGSGFLGQSESTLDVGLGAEYDQVDVDVRWPDGGVSAFKVGTGHSWMVFEP